MAGSRDEYEAEVRGIARDVDAMLAEGASILDVAHWAVRWRNELKTKYRSGLPTELLEAIEARNLVKYGDKIGPKAADLFVKYESWEAVIEAAARPSDLKDF